MKCKICEENLEIKKLKTYKHFWYFCNKCKNVFSKPRKIKNNIILKFIIKIIIFISGQKRLGELLLCSNNINLSCSEQQCRNICNNCYSEACKWNYSKKVNNEKLRPSRSKIKGFSGDKFIKITWIKPESKSELLKYYVILTTPTNNDFLQIYSFYDERELPEYIVKNLENGIPYGVSIISKNKIGVSDISNIETVIPSENSDLNDYSSSNTYDNSLQNYIENTTEGVDLKIQKSMYEKQMIIQELKDILTNNLKIKLDLQAYNVNIF